MILSILKIIVTIYLIVAFIFMTISGIWKIWYNYKLFKIVKNHEPEFFVKNINYNTLFLTPWMQFWLLMRKGKYVQLKDKTLQEKLRKNRIFIRIYSSVFILAIFSIIYIWISN